MEKLNLRPQERRLLAGVGLMLFLVFNVMLVWPHFKDWAVVKAKLAEGQARLGRYHSEIARIQEREAALRNVETDSAAIMAADPSIQLRRTVEGLSSHLFVQDWGSINQTRSGAMSTNQFFEEINMSIRVLAGEKDLVDFLYNVSSGSSSVRVRDLTLNPGPAGTNLASSITLVASYQKPPAKAARPTGKKP